MVGSIDIGDPNRHLGFKIKGVIRERELDASQVGVPVWGNFL
jgi:hypothetical protein